MLFFWPVNDRPKKSTIFFLVVIHNYSLETAMPSVRLAAQLVRNWRWKPGNHYFTGFAPAKALVNSTPGVIMRHPVPVFPELIICHEQHSVSYGPIEGSASGATQ